MNPFRFLADLRRRGVVLAVRLDVDAPAGALADDDRRALAEHKPRLVLLLAIDAVCRTEGLGVVAEMMESVHDIEERAGILEFEGGLPADLALSAAVEETLAIMGVAEPRPFEGGRRTDGEG